MFLSPVGKKEKKSSPDFSWEAERASGVLMHISSLPSDTGIGNFGAGADLFMDFLEESACSYWQLCPLEPTGFGDSPYQSFSAFAGNPYFIDLNVLIEAKLLAESEISPLRKLNRDRCEYGRLYVEFFPLLKLAHSRLNSESLKILENILGLKLPDFEKKYSAVLEDYFLFSALKRSFGGREWTSWSEEFKDCSSAKKQKLSDEIKSEISQIKFEQWLFFAQYANFKKRAKKRGIKIFGDIPIFLSQDSADVWANREIFQLNSNGLPLNVAGVGPDYFSAEGQLWGNPLYDWKANRQKVYKFWKRRIDSVFELYDVLRFDHFRGFADYWSIPAKSGDAKKGEWKKGPGEDFFEFLRKNFPDKKFVAEDLGLLSDCATSLRDSIKIPAMAVLQFAFGGSSSNAYLPHNLKRQNVCYTGTHDNATCQEWYMSSDEKTRDHFRRYMRVDGKNVHWDMIYAAIMTCSNLAIFPFQDILGLGAEARMNTPGKAGGNWQWRATSEMISQAKKNNAPYLKSLNILAGRAGNLI